MDARTEHLIALVKDGARLADAARVYGISGERVRQILKEGGMSARDLPGRAEKPRSPRFDLARELAPVIEAMWREGMLYHEIATVLDVSCGDVHRLVCERVPADERNAHTAWRLEAGRSSDERLLAGMRTAAGALTEAGSIKEGYRRHLQAVIDGWLVAHAQLTDASATSAPQPTASTDPTPPSKSPSPADLRTELDRFKAGLRARGLKESTINAYMLGSSLFVRWLAGDYLPRRPRAQRALARRVEAQS